MSDLPKKTEVAKTLGALNQEERTSWFEKGRLFKRQKDYNNAIVCFQTMLKSNGTDRLALNELYKCCLLVGRSKEGIDAVNRLMRLFVDEAEKMEALTMYGELTQLQPKHTFDQEVQVRLADWLTEVGDFGGAVTACTNYADRYPVDKRSPDLLLRAARLCNDELKDKPQTQIIVARISEQYPNSKAAEEAAVLFFNL